MPTSVRSTLDPQQVITYYYEIVARYATLMSQGAFDLDVDSDVDPILQNDDISRIYQEIRDREAAIGIYLTEFASRISQDHQYPEIRAISRGVRDFFKERDETVSIALNETLENIEPICLLLMEKVQKSQPFDSKQPAWIFTHTVTASFAHATARDAHQRIKKLRSRPTTDLSKKTIAFDAYVERLNITRLTLLYSLAFVDSRASRDIQHFGAGGDNMSARWRFPTVDDVVPIAQSNVPESRRWIENSTGRMSQEFLLGVSRVSLLRELEHDVDEITKLPLTAMAAFRSAGLELLVQDYQQQASQTSNGEFGPSLVDELNKISTFEIWIINIQQSILRFATRGLNPSQIQYVDKLGRTTVEQRYRALQAAQTRQARLYGLQIPVTRRAEQTAIATGTTVTPPAIPSATSARSDENPPDTFNASAAALPPTAAAIDPSGSIHAPEASVPRKTTPLLRRILKYKKPWCRLAVLTS